MIHLIRCEVSIVSQGLHRFWNEKQFCFEEEKSGYHSNFQSKEGYAISGKTMTNSLRVYIVVLSYFLIFGEIYWFIRVVK